MFDANFIFLLLTGFLLAILAAISVATLNAKRKEKLEEPKHRMLDDD